MKSKSPVAQISIVAAFAIVSYFAYSRFRQGTPGTATVDRAEQAPQLVAARAKAIVPPPTAQGTEAGFLPTQMEDPARFEAIHKGLQDMSTCLNMKMAPLDPQSEFSYDTLMSVIAPDMGDVVMKNDEWFSTDIRTPQGEVRRLYLEIASNFENEGQRTLKYYSLSEGGGQKEIPLSPEQRNDPSDTLLASLESDGAVIGQAKSQRTFFENGDNLLTVETNGKIYSFQLPHDGKVFMCTGMDSARSMKCGCR